MCPRKHRTYTTRLATLYAQYSRGMHNLSDEECLYVAHALHFALEYTFRNWRTQLEDAASFQQQIQTWSDPKATPEKPDDGTTGPGS